MVLVDDPLLVEAGSPNVYVVTNAGPYVVVDVRSVPQTVVSVPPQHWKHHPHGGPPGLARKHKGWVS